MMCKDLMKNAAPIMFGLIIMIAFLYVIWSLLNHTYPAENKDQLNSMLEFLKNAALIVVGFFFGASASSKAKDETISDIAKTAPISTGPTTILSAETVKNETKEGDINVTPKEPTK